MLRPPWFPGMSGLLIVSAEVEDGDDVQDQVDHHHQHHGQVEVNHTLDSGILYGRTRFNQS